MPLRFVALLTALLAMTILSAPPSQSGPRGTHGGPPAFAAADRWDRSRALRDIPGRPPQAGFLREAPRFRRAIGPKSIDISTSSNRIVNDRTFAVGELQINSHRLQNQQDIGKDNRCVDA